MRTIAIFQLVLTILTFACSEGQDPPSAASIDNTVDTSILSTGNSEIPDGSVRLSENLTSCTLFSGSKIVNEKLEFESQDLYREWQGSTENAVTKCVVAGHVAVPTGYRLSISLERETLEYYVRSRSTSVQLEIGIAYKINAETFGSTRRTGMLTLTEAGGFKETTLKEVADQSGVIKETSCNDVRREQSKVDFSITYSLTRNSILEQPHVNSIGLLNVPKATFEFVKCEI